MNHIAHAEIDRTPPKHDAAWTIGIAARPPQDAPVTGAREATFMERETLCEEGARARALIAALPERQRAAIVLTYYEELPNAEAAAMVMSGIEYSRPVIAMSCGSCRK